MRNIFPPLGLEAEPLQQPLLLGLQFKQRRDGRGRRNQSARLAAAEGREPVEPQLERPAMDASKQAGNVARQRIIDVADEAQRQVIIFGIDPARPRQTAAHHRKRIGRRGAVFQDL